MAKHSSDPSAPASQTPLAWLRQRKDKSGQPLISEAQFMAGERLRMDFERACRLPHVTANLSADGGGRRDQGGREAAFADRIDRQIAARQRLEQALERVGPDHAPVLLDVCCLASGIAQVETRYGWPQRSGKVVLSIALNELARHYGYLSGVGGRDLYRSLVQPVA